MLATSLDRLGEAERCERNNTTTERNKKFSETKQSIDPNSQTKHDTKQKKTHRQGNHVVCLFFLLPITIQKKSKNFRKIRSKPPKLNTNHTFTLIAHSHSSHQHVNHGLMKLQEKNLEKKTISTAYRQRGGGVSSPSSLMTRARALFLLFIPVTIGAVSQYTTTRAPTTQHGTFDFAFAKKKLRKRKKKKR